MPHSYANWASQATSALQLQYLNLHISEVSLGAGVPDVAADSKSVAFGSVTDYLRFLGGERDKLLARPDATGSVRGGRSLARVLRG